jgi:hypothetical protein
MNRTRVFVVAVLSAAALLVVGTLVWRTISGDSAGFSLAASRQQMVRITVITALPVEPWVRAAAEEFNANGNSKDGASIEVEVIPMDGLIALGKWERNDFGALPTDMRPQDLPTGEGGDLNSFPTAWIADSRYLVDLANVANRNRLGRDLFLSDGQYRVRPLAKTLLTWGLFRSRGVALLENVGPISWSTVHKAAIAPTGWKELGGDPSWGNFKLAVASPGKTVAGLAAIITAAGEYFDRNDVSVEDLSDPEFATWLAEVMGAATNLSGDKTSAAENVALFGFTAGDGGQFLESELLRNMEGIQTRWQEPVIVHYPTVTTWFDFPFAIWVGPETSAEQKNAALEFQRFLLSEAQQRRALSFGLRPTDSALAVDAADDSLFVRWQKLGVRVDIPPANIMQPPNRKLLPELWNWQDMNEAQ